ncbi:hypothetical protein [Aridibaculum aurantiacum]|uniref:hypothetical protein n=1 Tax=Aridibaculum aurantiacum TaxID=2810307 RepID=UPI001A95AC84|nr:hypothetical protein [Aridibaculum aurantiacum]
MKLPFSPVVNRLSIIIFFFAAIASAGGLLLPGLYLDKELYVITWKANDIVTFFFVLPAYYISLQAARHGSPKAILIVTGLLAYMLYNYAFYLFGAVFNKFFLLYVAIFSLSIYALFIQLATIDAKAIAVAISSKFPRRAIAIFLVMVTLPLAIFEIIQCVKFIMNGTTPAAPPLIFALDLSIVVPNTALAAVLLWRTHAWGFILAAIMLVKAIAYGSVLCLATTLTAINLHLPVDPLLPFYMFITIGGLISGFAFWRHVKPLSF